MIHAFYPDIFEEIVQYILDIPQSLKMYITTTENNKLAIANIISKYELDAEVHVVENKGRDILPFIKILPIVKAAGYLFILKIHTKKSKHRSDGDVWRTDLYDKLIRPERFNRAVSILSTDLSVGIIGPEGHILDMHTYWGSNERLVLEFANKVNLGKEDVMKLPFVGGSMFYARMDALECLLSINLSDDDFENEAGQVDGTVAHAVERFISVSALSRQQKVVSFDGVAEPITNYAYVK